MKAKGHTASFDMEKKNSFRSPITRQNNINMSIKLNTLFIDHIVNSSNKVFHEVDNRNSSFSRELSLFII